MDAAKARKRGTSSWNISQLGGAAQRGASSAHHQMVTADGYATPPADYHRATFVSFDNIHSVASSGLLDLSRAVGVSSARKISKER